MKSNKLLLLLTLSSIGLSQSMKERDTLRTPQGNVEITFLGHGTLMIVAGTTTIHIDPWQKAEDYTKLPKADLVLVTHQHFDHLDSAAVELIRKPSTVVVSNGASAAGLAQPVVMKNGESKTIGQVSVEAVPAYNLVHNRPDGKPFHPKGEGNGYVLTLNGIRIYVAGDTENIPEMKSLKNIDVAFLPMNLPYTMTPEMVADAVKAFKPKIFYPYHFGETKIDTLLALLKDLAGVNIRIRSMK